MARGSYCSCPSAACCGAAGSRAPGSHPAHERGALLAHERSGALRSSHCMLLCSPSLFSLSLSLPLFFSLSLSLLMSWCASLFDGTMRRPLAIVEAMWRRLPRCRRNCGPRGSVAGTIVGALCCERFCWVGAVCGMLSSTAPRWCSCLAVAASEAPIFSHMLSSRCLSGLFMFCDSV